MKYAVIPLRAAIDSNAMLGLLLLDLLNVTRACLAKPNADTLT